MTGTGVLAWLGRRDPGYRQLRRGARLTLVAAAGLFGGQYLLGNQVLALYTLFGAIATGFISKLPVSPAARARTLLAALPFAWLLVTAGSVLAVNTGAAVAGMLVVGFLVPFAGVGGPRMVGLATGLQLFYIAASFPPYALNSLPDRLAGVTLGVVLLILAELLLWPGPTPPSYPERLAGAARVVAGYLELVTALPAGGTVDRDELARRWAEANRALDGVDMSRLPPQQRPTAADARDRALREGCVLLRQMLNHVHRLSRVPAHPDADAAGLLGRAAALVRDAARTLAGGSPPVTLADLDGLTGRMAHLHDRPADPVAGGDGETDRLRRDVFALHIADEAGGFGMTARIAVGLSAARRAPGSPGLDDFWYASWSTPALYWRRFRLHLTPRSIYFQGALRVALALAAARLIAGYLHLNHGFWVLLAILTLVRTSAVETRTALRPVVLGTLLGAAAGSLLLTAGGMSQIGLVALPVALVLTFTIGPLLGQVIEQSFFTVLFILVFAQSGPANVQLAGARLLDVAIGAAVGVLAGVLIWPKGGGGELRLAMASYLEASAVATEASVRALAGQPARLGVLETARRAGALADASFLEYQSERHDPKLPPLDWQAALEAGHHMLRGAEIRLRHGTRTRLTTVADAADPLLELAQRLRRRYGDLARQLRIGRLRQPAWTPPSPDIPERVRAVLAAGEPRSTALNLVDVEVWLVGVGADLERLQPGGDDHLRGGGTERRERR
ncbi:FUSC family protein [Plantactinospora sp. CA-290183]|uniref:FUSC family protein n=1 Tax=Plantactinospora sp. CA-290183 TaxID=3240006 RepID=UPI003D8AB202